jgi:mannose-6-phosphate isomerase-like protein (cupin superfamily)
MNRSAWPGKSARVDKPWGHEISWSGIFQGKEIHIKEGLRTSLKFNSSKDEMLYVSTGKVYIEYAAELHFQDPVASPSESKILQPGDFINVQAGCPYRVTAMEDSIVFEISDDRSRSERIVIQDDYGRASSLDQRWIFISPKDK